MSPTRLSNYVPGRGPRARPMGRPGTARNSNESGRPEIQTSQAGPKFKQYEPFRAWAVPGRAARMYTYSRAHGQERLTTLA
jgi:hypothetical protein